MKKLFLKILIFISYLFFAKPVLAAEFFATASNYNLELGEFVQVDFLINSQNEEINAIQATIAYPKELLAIEEINYGNSVINYWLEKPQSINSEKIFFSGIIPGGFNENSASLISVIFKTKNLGRAKISFEQIMALKNDGLGTLINSYSKNLLINIQSNLPGRNLENVYKNLDQDPPEDFKPFIYEDNNIGLGKKVLIFNTLDKNSGIAKYEVLEEKVFNFFGLEIKFGRWQPAESPYFLKDQNLKSNIYVKAIDRAGNERIVTVTSIKPIIWYTNFIFWVIIIIIILLLLYLFWRVYVHHFKKNKTH